MRVKTDHQKRVEELMVNASQDIPDRPTMPDEKTRMLRARLIFEEALETIHALGVNVFDEHDHARVHTLDDVRDFDLIIARDREPDLEGIADGCADVSVVTIGTLSSCGITADSLLQEVDENNLLKFRHICPKCGEEYRDDELTVSEAIAHVQPMTEPPTIDGLRVCLNQDCGCTWRSGYHNEHGKWVKPENHPAPDIAGVLQKQTDDVEAAEVERTF